MTNSRVNFRIAGNIGFGPRHGHFHWRRKWNIPTGFQLKILGRNRHMWHIWFRLDAWHVSRFNIAKRYKSYGDTYTVGNDYLHFGPLLIERDYRPTPQEVDHSY